MPNKKVTKIVTIIPADEQKTTEKPKRRVAAYARVSTLSEEQETSIVAQRDYFQKLIQNREDWIFVDVYYDDGISGTAFRNREGFSRMIGDALDGKIDLILTKSLSRFARNTVDTLTTIRKLKEKGVEVYFEKEDIYTLDSKGEFLITLMSSLAQEESRSLSENVTWGIRKRYADGEYYITGKFLGFDKDKSGKLIVNNDEAGIVRLIFRLYLYGLSLKAIGDFLRDQNITTVFECENWAVSTVSGVLRNEKYVGDALLQKSYTVDFLNKKQKANKGEVPQYYIENDHDPIVSREVFAECQKELAMRDSRHGEYSCIGIFSKVLVCSCGSSCGHRVMHPNSKYEADFWRCNAFYNGGEHSPLIREETLCRAVYGALEWLWTERKEQVTDLCRKVVKNSFPNTEECFDFINSWSIYQTPEIDRMLLNSVVSKIVVQKDKKLLFKFVNDKKFLFEMEKVKKEEKNPSESKQKRLTSKDKDDIRFYRKSGYSYGKIAKMLGLNASAIKAFCRKEGLGGYGKDLQDKCKHCGAPLEHIKGRKKKVFCDDRCRQQYWYYLDK